MVAKAVASAVQSWWGLLAELKPPIPVSYLTTRWVGSPIVEAEAAVFRAIGSPTDNNHLWNSANSLREQLYRLTEFPVPPSILRGFAVLFEDAGGQMKPSGAAGRKRKRASGKVRKPRPPTGPEVEAMQIVGECKGNIAEAARRLGKDRKTVEQAYRNGLEKFGKEAYRSKDKARLLARDKRGQDAVSSDDDRRL